VVNRGQLVARRKCPIVGVVDDELRCCCPLPAARRPCDGRVVSI